MANRQDATNRANLAWEIGGLLALGGLAVFYLVISWRKWPDPTIDFGRELYLPWRLSQGAVLFRDVDDFYGPLSQYFNSAIFRIFGPGLMTLVSVNLVIFTAISGTLYCLFRTAWGVIAALVSVSVFVSVFAFGQYVGIGNTNYAAPYSHEATHGVLVGLLLTATLLRWVRGPSVRNSLVAGFLLGLTAVLKPEIMFAAGAVTAVAIAERIRLNQPTAATAWVATGFGAILPTGVFALFFSRHLPPGDALAAACHAWLTAISGTRYVADAVQLKFLGLDEPWRHFWQHVFATVIAIAFFGFIAVNASWSEKIKSRQTQILHGALALAAVFWVVWTKVDWSQVGRCFLGTVLVYLMIKVARHLRPPRSREFEREELARTLIATLGAALMARMILNGRVAQFGFYQAAVAGMTIPAVMLREVPVWLKLQFRGRLLVTLGTVVTVGAGVVVLSYFSAGIFRVKTFEVGRGVDRFYVMPPNEDPMGLVVNSMVDALRPTPNGETMVVLPEGLMLNYLTRRPSPVRPFFFFSAATKGGRELELVQELDRKPPDWVMIISRDLSEYGIKRYGEASGSGQDLLAWVEKNYDLAASIGADPFERGQRAARLYSRRGAP